MLLSHHSNSYKLQFHHTQLQVRSWEDLGVNWSPAKSQHFRACYWMAWLLAGCFQVTFLFLLLGKSLLARLFAEPMLLDEPLPCALLGCC